MPVYEEDETKDEELDAAEKACARENSQKPSTRILMHEFLCEID